jgi:hypothetical protein
LTWRDDPTPERVRLFFNQGQLLIDMGLENLPVALLEQTLEHLSEGTNISAALWFSQQIAQLD